MLYYIHQKEIQLEFILVTFIGISLIITSVILGTYVGDLAHKITLKIFKEK
tara:strand:- start:17 stop:169 length:153 start_codon:yes stop_codon:yes gene_type:complete